MCDGPFTVIVEEVVTTVSVDAGSLTISEAGAAASVSIEQPTTTVLVEDPAEVTVESPAPMSVHITEEHPAITVVES